ncbi:MAG: hypothetical protein V4574_04020 [Pseudomonadota bacterium]
MRSPAIRRLLPLAALLLPAPALADTTARYAAGQAIFTVEVDDGGNARAGIDGRFALIRRDGVIYVVLYPRDGAPQVARADAVLTLMGEVSKPPETWRTEFTAEGDATVAGYRGSVWRFGPAGDPPLEFLMSADPALAPVGAVFRGAADVLAAFIAAHVTEGDPVGDVRSLFSHGTPIRLRETRPGGGDILTLQSVGTGEIDSHRFDLPGPVAGADAFVAAIRPMGAPIVDEGTTVTTVPPPRP